MEIREDIERFGTLGAYPHQSGMHGDYERLVAQYVDGDHHYPLFEWATSVRWNAQRIFKKTGGDKEFLKKALHAEEFLFCAGLERLLKNADGFKFNNMLVRIKSALAGNWMAVQQDDQGRTYGWLDT